MTRASDGRRGKLSIVATPIGNLEDVTLRALRTLRESDVILAEDTRRTRGLLTHHGIARPLRALHAHSDRREILRAVAELRDGKHLALVTDAGTPLVSDPGMPLVTAAREHGDVTVECVPGPSAVLAALTVAGVPWDGFRFAGFLPRGGRPRRQALARLAADDSATVVFESPARLHATLLDLAEVLGATRQVAVCRELTKLHEEVVRGSASALARQLTGTVRGEITLVIEGAPEAEPSLEHAQASLDASIDAALAAGGSVRDVVQSLLGSAGLSRSQLYARVGERKASRG